MRNRPDDLWSGNGSREVIGIYTIIDTQAGMDDFLARVGHFHDALIREVAIVNRGFVATDGCMYGDQVPCDARLVFHSQYPTPFCIEMIFASVRVFRLQDHSVLYGNANGTVCEDEATICSAEAPDQGNYMISAGLVKYRILGRDRLGEELRAVLPIAVDEDHCPVCGYDALWFRPWNGDTPSDKTCPSCGIRFGRDDAADGNLMKRTRIHRRWREVWVADEMPWQDRKLVPPEDWCPVSQLRRVIGESESDD